MKHGGQKSLADRLWLEGTGYQTVPGFAIPAIYNFYSFPFRKFNFEFFTKRLDPKIYEYLLKKTSMRALPKSDE